MLGTYFSFTPAMPGLLKSFIYFMTNFLAVLCFGFGLCLTGRPKHLPTPRKSYVSELEVQLDADRQEIQECKRLNRVYIERVGKLEKKLDQADLEKTKLESEKDEAQRLCKSANNDLDKIKRQVEKLNSENARLRAKDHRLNASEVAGELMFFEDSGDDLSGKDCKSSRTVGLKKPLQPQNLQFGSTSRQQDVVGHKIRCENFEKQHSKGVAKTSKEDRSKASQLQKSCDTQQARIQELEEDKKGLQTQLNQGQIAKKAAEEEKDEAVKAYNNIVKEKRDVENTLQEVREFLHNKEDEKDRKDGDIITKLTRDKEAAEGERDGLKVQIVKVEDERRDATLAKDDAEKKQASMELELQKTKDDAEKIKAKLELELRTTKESLIQRDGHVQDYDKRFKAADQTITNLRSQIPAIDQQTYSQEAVTRLIQDARQYEWNEEVSPRQKHIDRLQTEIQAAVVNLRLQAEFKD
ncbi:MAG: hypothetical protein LQ350_007433 [Teloschistes chrysophthalmus]|nr:MAG: hypothetical protein LQ350_007433 [Niorma chrysophthalma]